MYWLERLLLITVVMISFGIIWLIPKEQRLKANFVFLFAGLPVWILGLLVVELGLIEYPVRELHQVNRTSFIFEYLALPVLCALFTARYPEGAPVWKRIGYYVLFCSALTIAEYMIQKYTLLIRYVRLWDWYWTFVSEAFVFWLTRRAAVLFFKDRKPVKPVK
ncbi:MULTISPECIES: CBO0543 family protein [unclassified Paenibacillus]|uniref:CBO0543 family protein n=1 Tax=unclassified Paenibacillus TaxID=185978 RepID=UPI001141D600|nr:MULTISPECIES: CBO0543 family protein [unclassified Paenibacillus]